jgi:pimeloyl-ACP methyl ester carboxylesterase
MGDRKMKADCSFARAGNGLSFAYVEQGNREGAALLMLHGYTDSHRSFDLLRPHLPEAWRTIAMTQRGHGRSDKPEAGYALADLAADAVSLLDALGVERAVLVGHSMGAAVALQAAADHPGRVAGLVLIGGFADYDKPEVEELAQGVAAMGDVLDPEFVLAFQESTIHHMIPQRFLDAVVGESLRCPPHVWRAALDGQVQANVLQAAQRCQAPALLIRGEHDAFVPLADQFKLREALPSARVFTIPGVGHAPHWERPEQVAAMVRAFVGERDEPAHVVFV